METQSNRTTRGKSVANYWFSCHNPMWLPKGTIRALLTFSIVGASIYLILTKSPGDPLIDEWWAALTVFVVKDYFAVRESERAREEMDKVLENMHEERERDRIIDSQGRERRN